MNGILCALVLLVLWRAEELVEACSCAPVHPQQAFCNADVGECPGLFTGATAGLRGVTTRLWATFPRAQRQRAPRGLLQAEALQSQRSEKHCYV